jgi:methyl-accepting chemotaxis protein
MESRGIYMSEDWKAAERFAQNLVAKLVDLQKVAQTWKAEVIASQYNNIEELAIHIDNFARFRTELVRIAREQDVAAARAFGDNDANRKTRAALNEALSVVARAYEQETARAHSQIESKEQRFLAVLSVLVTLSVLVLYGGLILVKRGLLSPLLEMKDLMLRLAQGRLDINVGDQQRSDEIGEMARAVQVFHATRAFKPLNGLVTKPPESPK